MTSTTRGFHVLPPSEDRCVWMTAGILSFQLCDHRFECDYCPLDAAMRKHRSPMPAEEVQPALPLGMALSADRLYSINHCWVQDQGNGRVRIGLEPALASALLPPKEVVYPVPGQRLARGLTCLWVVMDGETLPLKSPLDGSLRATNETLVASPHVLQLHPLEQGWLFEVSGAATGRGGEAFMEREGAAAVYATDETRLMISIHDALRSRYPTLGVTLESGVPRVESVVRMLGPSRYLRLLRRAFRN